MQKAKCEFCGMAFICSRREGLLASLREHLLGCEAFGLRQVLRAAVRIRITAHDLLTRYERFMADEHATTFLDEEIHASFDRLAEAANGARQLGQACPAQLYDRAADPTAQVWEGHVRAGGD